MPPQFPAAAQVLSLTDPLSIYIHIPFCERKCNYCAFYSRTGDSDIQDAYTAAVINQIKLWGGRTSRPVCTVYFGGGTPSVLGSKRLTAILNAVRNSFNVNADAEITVEANPADNLAPFFKMLKKAGFNRVSLGVQSANDDELRLLGRRHNTQDVVKCIRDAKNAGFDNISLDLMIGLPYSGTEKLKKSLDFVFKSRVQHISVYILKCEEGTPLYNSDCRSAIPDDDAVADQYLYVCDTAEKHGYKHYEISNFALNGFESRHNSRYWLCKEYLGFGPSAHSFFNGKRFYYTADIHKYIADPTPVPDGYGGDLEEYVMLGLRLRSGISSTYAKHKYSAPLPESMFDKARILEKNRLCVTDGDRIFLTDKGMLVSNSIITQFLQEI